jgi:hypothetical protein
VIDPKKVLCRLAGWLAAVVASAQHHEALTKGCMRVAIQLTLGIVLLILIR